MKQRIQRWKKLLKIAWPLIVANSFWNLQLTIDRVFLGQHSTEALAATVAVMGIFWTPMALLQQTAAYVTTFVAQYFGAKKFEMIGPAVWQAIYVSLFGGLLFVGLIVFSPWVVELIGHSEALRPLEIDYFNALCFSALPTALVAVVSGFYTGLGKNRIIIVINLIGLVVNAVLDYLLIFGNFGFPALGVIGAGIATAIANLIAAMFGLYLILGSEHEALYRMRSGWRINFDLFKRFLRYGLPSGMQWALEGLAFTIFLVVIGRMTNGDAALAASGIVVTVMMLAILPSLGIAQAVTVLVGQALGDKQPARAEEAAWSGLQVVFLYIAVMAITFALFPEFYMNWFRTDAAGWPQVAEIVPTLLLFVAAFICFDSMNLIFSFTLKGAGDTKFVTLLALLLPWPLMVAPSWYVKDWPGAVYWAWGAASGYIVCQALVFLWRFRGGKWKSMSVIGDA